MRLAKTIWVIAVAVVFWGCSSSTDSDGGNNNGGGSGTDEPTQYTLSVDTSPSGGGTVDPSTGTYDEGTEVTVEATANSGYTFSGWTGDQQSTENPLTFTINEDTDLTANFDEEQPTEYTLSLSKNPNEGGSVIPSGGGTYQEGADVTVEATPSSGWKFDGWTGDKQSADNPFTFTITQNTSLTANFSELGAKYAVELKVTNTVDTLALDFGQQEGATDGFDDGFDKDAPPAPPSGALHAFFEVNSLDLFKDFRSNTDDPSQWTLKYQLDSGQDLKLEWAITDDTRIPGTIVLSDDADSFEVDMLDTNSHTISGSTSGTLIITYSTN